MVSQVLSTITSGEPEQIRTVMTTFGFGNTPIAALCSEELPLTKASALLILRVAGSRWDAELATRAMKDRHGFGLEMEQTRAMTLRGQQRLVLLATLVYGYLARLREEAPARARALAGSARVAGILPRDIRYRLVHAIAAQLARELAQPDHHWWGYGKEPPVPDAVPAAALFAA